MSNNSVNQANSDFIIGPIQESWLQSLEQNPDRQYRGQLGIKYPYSKTYLACCLGEAGIILGTCKWKMDKNSDNEILISLSDNKDTSFYILEQHDQMGLRCGRGSFKEPVPKRLFDRGAIFEEAVFRSLAVMNDEGLTWLQIATYIRSNPTNVFTRSV